MFGINFINVFVRNVFGVSTVKTRRARRTPADRIEWLETRQVLSASTFATVAQLNVVTTDLPFDVVEAAQNDVVFSESRLLQMGRVRGGITSVSFDVSYGTNPEDVVHPELYADLRDARGRLGRGDGIAETRIGAGVIQDIAVVFDTTAFAKKIGRGVVLQFRGDISADAQHGDLIGFEEAEAFTRDGLISSINYLGGENPLYVVEGKEIRLSVAMGSSVGTTAAPGDISVELGTLDFNATAPTNISQMFVAVTRTDSTGAGYEFAESIPFLYLLNTQTGSGQQLELVGLQNEVAVYRAVDLTIDGYTKFLVLSDFSDNVNDGDQFTLHAIYETGYGPLSIGSLTDTVDYRLQAYGLGGEQVEEVHAGVYSGSPVTIADSFEVNIAVQAIGTSETVVSNEKNVTLFRYETLVTPGDAILMTEAVFTAQAGSLLNAQNYSLWVDTDSDLVVDWLLQNGVSAINGKVVFDDIAGGGYIYSDWNVITEVRADIASNPSPDNRLQLAFAPENIGAEVLHSGAEVPAWNIHVFEVPSKLFTVERNGSLFVTQSSTPVRPQYLLAGTKELGQRLTFRAETEDGEVTGITFALPSAASVDRIELYRVGETTPFAVATTGGAAGETPRPGYTLLKTTMQAGQFKVAEATEQEALAYVRLKSDENGAVSSEQITLHLHKVEARGVSSFSDYRVNDGDTVNEGEVFLGTSTPGTNQAVTGPTQTVVFAEVTSATNWNPEADFANIPTGVRTIGQFKISAASNSNTLNGLNKVMLKSMSFLVTANNVQFSTSSVFKIFNVNDPSWKLDTSVVDLGNGTYRATITFPGASVVDRLIGSGESDTFAFEANVANSKVDPALQSSLQVILDTESIVWSDPDTSSTSTFTGLKLSDRFIKSTFYRS